MRLISAACGPRVGKQALAKHMGNLRGVHTWGVTSGAATRFGKAWAEYPSFKPSVTKNALNHMVHTFQCDRDLETHS